MHLIAKVITILRAKFHCNRLKTVQDIQDYTSLIILAQCRINARDEKEYVDK